MDYKPQPWQLVLLIALFCGAAIGGLVWYRSRTLTPADYLQRMPIEESVILWVDFNQLRQAGIIQLFAGAKVGEDPEYQAFVQETRFNYLEDLSAAMVAFAPGGNFLLVKGKFDWKTLRDYTVARGGACPDAICRMSGSAPDRKISFYPLRADVMAMAVSPDTYGVLSLQHRRPGAVPPISNAPIWLSFPGSILKSGKNLPDGARPFARALQNALTVTISFAPEGQRLAARLEVHCTTAPDAVDMAGQLNGATQLLRSLIEREHKQPNPADFSGVFSSGSFRADGAVVFGYWPIERTFVQNLLGSQ